MDLRPRSIGQILDRAVTVSIQNSVALSTIVASTILLALLARLLMVKLVFSHVPHGFPLEETQLMVVSQAETFVGVAINYVISGLAIMAGAVAIEDALCGTRPVIRDAFSEAFREFGKSTLVSLWFLVPLAIASNALVAIAVTRGLSMHVLIVVDLGIVWLIEIPAAALATTGVSIVWVHLVLRRADLSSLQLIRICFSAKPTTRTILAVVTILIAINVVSAVDAIEASRHLMPIAAFEVLHYGVAIASSVFLVSFVTLYYLDLCSRYAGADLQVMAAAESD